MRAYEYQSRQVEADGSIAWTATEHDTWRQLIDSQNALLPQRACDAYLSGIETLGLSREQIPSLATLNQKLQQCSGWQIATVPALINFDRFFALLANRQFPVATFIRRLEDMEYLQEPDIFHEIFGHCPMLTDPDFAAFTHTYGQLGLHANHQQRVYLARLYWFTVEFGLLQTPVGLRIYGGGILSSPRETLHALDSQDCRRAPFELMTVLTTPYRIDHLQPIYYVIHDLKELYQLTKQDLLAAVNQAIGLKQIPLQN